MSSRLTLSLALLALATAARAQTPTTTDRLSVDRNAVHGPSLEEPPRQRAPLGRDAIPDEPPPPSGIETPTDFLHRGVTYDARTGRQIYRDLPLGPRIPQAHVAAVATLPQPEEMIDSFGAFTPVTGTGYPWSTMVRLFYVKGGQNFVCSGTLVGPRTVLTAGHCVHEGAGGNWATNMRVVPEWDGDDDAWGQANGVGLHAYTGWTQNGDFNWDIGYITLDRPFGFLTNWLGYGYTTDDSFYTTETFHNAGYPGCSNSCVPSYAGCPDQLYYCNGPFDFTSPFWVQSTLTNWSFSRGTSGSAFYWINGNGTRIAHGVASRGNAVNCVGTSRTFARLTQPTFDDLSQNVIPSAYGPSLDLVVLDVDSASSVRAGARLPSFDYLVANASDADPGPATYQISVYLSSNDNITSNDTLLQTRTFVWDFAPRSSVRISASAGLPRLPQNLWPQNYWIGVRIDLADANIANNTTQEWDAHEIDVDLQFPVPTQTLTSRNGSYFVDFESPSLPYMQTSGVNGDTFLPRASAWTNHGAIPCLDPFRGQNNLELGNNPNVRSVTPANVSAAVFAFGGGSENYVLDFMLADHEEEPDPNDGVWISQTGQRWYPLTPNGWGSVHGIASGEWYSVRGIGLTGTTPVSTANRFLLAFVAEGTAGYGRGDGVGIDDIRVRPFDQFTFTASEMVSGSTGLLHMHGGTPNGVGCVLIAAGGTAGVPTVWGTFFLAPPILVVDCPTLNLLGDYTMAIPLAPGFSGAPLWWQALDITSGTLSNALDTVLD